MKGEKGNICSMPEVVRLEIHRSKDTGKLYGNFIAHDKDLFPYCHRWDNTYELTAEEVKTIADIIVSKAVSTKLNLTTRSYKPREAHRSVLSKDK